LECAVVAAATHVVTGDRRHLLPMRNYAGIAIVSPAVFLAEVVQG
jgi:predicted nucleic acid-binding protein